MIANTFTVDQFATVKIILDDTGSTESPLDHDEAIIFAVLHRRYDNPAEADGLTSPEAIAEFAAENAAEWDEFPLYMIDHSGTAYRVSQTGNPFRTCDPGEWDSGRVGSVFVKRADVGPDALTAANVACEQYTHWANGNIWGYVIETPDDDHVDSCWGFIGDSDDEYLIAEATAAAKYAAAQYADKVATCMAASIAASRPDMQPHY